MQSRFVAWLLLPFCQDLESFAHVLVAFFNICGCGKITDNLFEASKLVFSGSDFQEATWDLSALLNTQQLHFQHSNFGFGESRFKQLIAINSAPRNPLPVFIAALVL